MPFQNRMMTLVAFLQAQNCSNLPGSWRHPSTTLDFLTPEYYQRIARTLEDGKIQMAFFDDRLALPDLYTGHHAEAVAAGVRAVKMDPSTILMTMGMVTQRLGLGVTYSTTYYEPFHVARLFATMDLMLKGRAAWNIVTSLNRAEAANFGRDEHMGHDARYDRADEFMEVVLGHWNTWEDDALILDKANNRFADPAKVHRLDHMGRYFRSRGPFSVPRSPQGYPVLIQAGQSGRGQAFAAKWAEVVFVIYHSLEDGRKEYASFKAAVAAAGRDPARVYMAPACYVCVGETEAVAQEKRAVIEATARDVDALVLLSEVLNYDFAKKQLDEPFSDEELAELSFQGFRDRVIRHSCRKNPTVRDFINVSGRGTVKEHTMFCGSPKQVADQMEEWFAAPACDGFVLAASHMPGAYDDVVRLLVPELQHRGLFQKDYAGPTLRDNLGLQIPRARLACGATVAGIRSSAFRHRGIERRTTIQPLRSFLFAPGNHTRRVANALSLDADAVILDLEDAVATAEKPAARDAVVTALALPRRPLLYVRVNAAETEFCYGDLVAIVRPGLDGIVLPKVESATTLATIDWLLAQLEHQQALVPQAIDLIPIIETARGLGSLEVILGAGTRVRHVAFGAGDFTLDVNMAWSRLEAELAFARARIATASRAAGIEAPFDTVWVDLADEEGLEMSTRTALGFGFQGKMCIHPKQIAPVNRVFTPGEAEIAYAERVVAAFVEAEAAGSAAIQLDGKFIDYPILYRAQRVLQKIAAIRAKEEQR